MFARQDPDARDRAQFALLVRENPLPYYRLQPWPLPISSAALRTLEETSLGLVRADRRAAATPLRQRS